MLRMPRPYWLLLLASEAILSGCAGQGSPRPPQATDPAIAQKQSLESLRDEARRHPDDVALQQRYYLQRDRTVLGWMQEVQDALSRNQLDVAQNTLQRILEIDPQNPMATTLQSRLQKAQDRSDSLSQTRQLLGKGQLEDAQRALQKILAQNPNDADARQLADQIRDAKRKQDLAHALDAKYAQEKVSLEFQNAPLRGVFYALSQQSGLNFSFDPNVALDANATLYAKDTPVLSVLDMLLTTHHLRQHVINGNTLGISAEAPLPQPVTNNGLEAKAFYLTNVQPKAAQDLLQTMTTLRNIYVDDTLNLIVVRGNGPEIQAAQHLIAMIDRAPPEVMLDVEVLEVKRDLLRDLGMEYPNQFGLLNVTPSATSVTTNTSTTVTTPSTTPLTVQSLRSISASQITINQLMLNLKDDSGNVKLLANPRIRVKNQVQAQIKIGEKVPVFNSNTTSTGVISSSVSYLDVGLDLKVKPTVMLDNDVQIQIALEVSNILNQVSGGNGTVGYQIGTRDANTTLRLADGQTQILAGLISDERQQTFSGIPGLGRIPVVGWLFSDHQDTNSKTEIVLLITPHIIRNLDTEQAAEGNGAAFSTAYATPGQITPAARPPVQSPPRPQDTAAETAALPKNLPPGFIPPGTRLPPGFQNIPASQ